VVDEEGTSTVWDDLFPTDREALDEALKAIREEGFIAFTKTEKDILH
jgi:TRAP-type C4-dicarboxylate transport system substrate-binding protein